MVVFWLDGFICQDQLAKVKSTLVRVSESDVGDWPIRTGFLFLTMTVTHNDST